MGLVNDALRQVIGLLLVALGIGLEMRLRIRLTNYRRAQRGLRGRYDVTDATPILPYGPEQRANIAAAAARFGPAAQYAMTSGSTAEPKRILYPPERLARAKRMFIDAFARSFVRAPWQRQSFYLFSSLHQDDSLTSLMVAEDGLPRYLATLQAPYRLQSDPAFRTLAREYGDAALRLWVIALSNPGLLYSTNPSTLSVFLDTLQRDWSASTALIRDYVRDPAPFPLAKRLVSCGASTRLRRIAQSERPLPFFEIAPAVHTYVCWTGGYVQPFLNRLAEYLPASRYRQLPMYSMSTETPETTPSYRGDAVSFVPLAPGVLYEFLPDNAADDPALLVRPDALAIGGRYTMIVSDDYGLRRYQTDDVFACVGRVAGLPDLRFERRRSLSYSFTGEKLTGQQLSMAYERMREELPELGFLTCVPSSPGGDVLPHYRLVGVSDAPMDLLAERCDTVLNEINSEYGAKRLSGRLGPMRGMTVTLDELVARVCGGSRDSWETQFKFLPLYCRTWESCILPA